MRQRAFGDSSGAAARPGAQQYRPRIRGRSVATVKRRCARLCVRAGRDISDANFPRTADGCTYHLGTKRGQVSNRILTVGSVSRAEMLSKLLQPLAPGMTQPLSVLSSRGFLTATGLYNGVPVSIVSHLMGIANMDFMVRECRAVTDGTMAVVRLGTCGALQPPAKLGDLLVASAGAIFVRRDPDAWTLNDGTPPYATSLPVLPDAELSAALAAEGARQLGPQHVVEGLNATADSFYSSQGRVGGDFDDRNSTLASDLCKLHPNLLSMEMETFQMLDLARCSNGSIRAASMCIALAERYSNRFLEHNKLLAIEMAAGRIALTTLSQLRLEDSASFSKKLLEISAATPRLSTNGNGNGMLASAFWDGPPPER